MFLTIGTISGSFGVRGEVKAIPQSDHPERFTTLPGMMVFLSKNGVRDPYKVKQASEFQGNWKLSFAEVTTKEQAQALVGAEIQIPREKALPLPEGVFYIFEVIGMQVFLEDETILGTVREVLQPGANDVYVVDSQDGREYLIPAIKQVVMSMDRETRRIVVRPLPGLFDEDDIDAD